MSSLSPVEKGSPVFTGQHATQRLQQLGVDSACLTAALEAGDVAARQADQFSPVTAAGLLRWCATVQTLRQGLVTTGWTLNDDRNSPKIIDPTEKIALVPVRGNSATGVAEQTPKTARPRGLTTERAVQINGQLEIPYGVPFFELAAEKTSNTVTWFLLYYRAIEGQLHAELSLPIGLSAKGIVEQWRERIILPPLTFEAPHVLPRDAGDNDDFDFDIAVR